MRFLEHSLCSPHNSFRATISEEATPVPIPNTAVKLLSGGSSWSAGSRKISASPGLISLNSLSHERLFLFVSVEVRIRICLSTNNSTNSRKSVVNSGVKIS